MMYAAQLKRLYPMLLAILLVSIMAFPMPVPGLNSFMPLLNIILIYYWCLYRPNLMPFWFLFFLGGLQDILLMAPLGFNVFFNLIAAVIILKYREHFIKEHFWIVWRNFGIFTFFVVISQWLMMVLISGHLYALMNGGMQWITTMLCYPLIHRSFNNVDGIIPQEVEHA